MYSVVLYVLRKTQKNNRRGIKNEKIERFFLDGNDGRAFDCSYYSSGISTDG